MGVPDHSSPSLEAQRDAPVGGQAVLEGVMMRGVSTWAVATRKDGEISVESHPVVSWVKGRPALRAPVGRIHWAGAECSPVWNGYMEGAVRSGETTADDVAAALR